MKKAAATWVLLALLVSALTVSGVGEAMEVGSGAPERCASRSTMLIHDVYELQNISLDLNGSYELAYDIDASATRNWNGGAGFAPVGNQTCPFLGTMDGKGYNVTGLFINHPEIYYVGLFGYGGKVGAGGKKTLVKNIGVININATGKYAVGGLVGYICGDVINSFSSGNVTAICNGAGGLAGGVYAYSAVSSSHSTANVTANDCAGGLLGDNGGAVNNSYAAGNVTGGSGFFIGGLVGYNGDVVKNSCAAGNVNGSVYVGGLAGYVTSSARVESSYATGNVNGDLSVGGLVGSILANGNVKNSYARGNVAGTDGDNIGGFAGSNDGMVSNSYSTGNVTGPESVGGFVGENKGTVSSCFWDKEASGLNWSAGGTGKTTREMQTLGTFVNAGWDFNNVWCMAEHGTYPILQWQRKMLLTADAGADQAVDQHSPITFNGSGSRGMLPIANYTWTFTDKATRTLYGVGPTCQFDESGVFVVTLKVTDVVGNWGIDTMTVTVKDITAPIADAGPDQKVYEGTLVNFSGSGSSDNIRIANYIWTFTDGGNVTLFGVRPAYRFHNPGQFVVTLNVTDAAGNWGTDTMNVTVVDAALLIAEAGPDLYVDEGTTVAFNGSGSYDSVGIVNYNWTFYDGAAIKLYGVRPTYRFCNPGVFVAALNVTDAKGNWGIDNMTVTVKDITAPIAEAGPDRTIDEGTVVAFNASGSSDNVGIINFSWTFDYGTRRVMLYGVAPSFTFGVPGVYRVTVNVSDAAGLWRMDAMTLTARDITPPVADAGRDLTVLAESIVVFNGSLSTDNVAISKFFWNFTYNGKAQSLEGKKVSFKFDKPGIYEVVLTVIDVAGNRGEDTVVVTVEPSVNVDVGFLTGILWVLLLIIIAVGAGYYIFMKRKNAITEKPGKSEISQEPGLSREMEEE